MTRARLSIDYGCSHTVAILGWSDGRRRPLLFDASPLLPSAVSVDPDGELRTGREALAGAQRDPGRFEPSPKRQADAGSVLLGDRQVPVVDLVAAVLRRVGDEAARMAGGRPDELVLTHPAGWGPTRRAMLRSAAEAAGLPVPLMVAEPAAAAGYFLGAGPSPVPDGMPLLVYDLGGGTFDVSVVRRTAEGVEVLASDGLSDLGGMDLDAAVVRLIGDGLAGRAGEAWARLTNPVNDVDRRGFRALWDAARAAKETLSRHPSASVFVPLAEIEVHVTREQFEREAAGILALTTDLTQSTLRRVGLGPAEVAGIFLVGGATRTPLVATLLHRTLGRAPTVFDQPELVVAEGALLAGPGGGPATAGTAADPGAPPPPTAPPPGTGGPAGPATTGYGAGVPGSAGAGAPGYAATTGSGAGVPGYGPAPGSGGAGFMPPLPDGDYRPGFAYRSRGFRGRRLAEGIFWAAGLGGGIWFVATHVSSFGDSPGTVVFGLVVFAAFFLWMMTSFIKAARPALLVVDERGISYQRLEKMQFVETRLEWNQLREVAVMTVDGVPDIVVRTRLGPADGGVLTGRPYRTDVSGHVLCSLSDVGARADELRAAVGAFLPAA